MVVCLILSIPKYIRINLCDKPYNPKLKLRQTKLKQHAIIDFLLKTVQFGSI